MTVANAAARMGVKRMLINELKDVVFGLLVGFESKLNGRLCCGGCGIEGGVFVGRVLICFMYVWRQTVVQTSHRICQ